MRNLILSLITLTFLSCNSAKQPKINKTETSSSLNIFMDDWHKDVATFNYNAYFNKIDSLGYFIGTDASEVWTKTEFEAFSKPYFDKKQTWDFKALDRHFFINETGDIAWFNEVLDTWMGLCRGSGILQKKNGEWKIMQYVLSVTIPNDDIKPVIAAKQVNDSIAKATYIKR
ncbi:MAG: nuclear transport factor 2 family protein [Flavobacteriales bacterium]|jgi:hypothetical protein|nr:nuclear transport factor 2 family protein [Flavobacteriales bacterium]